MISNNSSLVTLRQYQNLCIVLKILKDFSICVFFSLPPIAYGLREFGHLCYGRLNLMANLLPCVLWIFNSSSSTGLCTRLSCCPSHCSGIDNLAASHVYVAVKDVGDLARIICGLHRAGLCLWKNRFLWFSVSQAIHGKEQVCYDGNEFRTK